MRTVLTSIILMAFTLPAHSIQVVRGPTYDSLDRRRDVRRSTQFLILHTTESDNSGAIHSLSRRGEANYLIELSGIIIELLPVNKLAMHAGLSMWDGIRGLSNHSVGIEVEGFHHLPITPRQKQALKNLISRLKDQFSVRDDKVLPHSMVAYGAPNRWHRHNHRGRKRCGMQFGDWNFRQDLGLGAGPLRDPDVEAGRLVVADEELHDYLFAGGQNLEDFEYTPGVITGSVSAWDIARGNYNDYRTIYTFPNGTVKAGNEITNWNRIPQGTKVSFLNCDRDGQCEDTDVPARVEEDSYPNYLEIGKDGNTAYSLVAGSYNLDTTIYFLPQGEKYRIHNGEELSRGQTGFNINSLPEGTRIITDYTFGGRVTAQRPPQRIAGNLWNNKSTIYFNLSDSTVAYGDRVQPDKIPRGTVMLFKSPWD